MPSQPLQLYHGKIWHEICYETTGHEICNEMRQQGMRHAMRQQGMIYAIIIMYIYHALNPLIIALSTYTIHINLNTVLYIHVEHNPTKTIYTRYYTHTRTHNDYSRNWVLILAGVEILWEKEDFQFVFKRWQGWAVSKVLWEWIPHVESKARESTKAMTLVFVLLDFQHAGVRRRAQCTRWSVDM